MKAFPAFAVARAASIVFGVIEGRGDSLDMMFDPKEMYINQVAAKLGGQNMFSNMLGEGEQIFSSWEEMPEDKQFGYEVLSVCGRIATSWMLYLESLRPTEGEWRSPDRREPLSATGAAGVITDPANLFRIVGTGRLNTSRENLEAAGRRNGKGFVRPHWRRAHYRSNSPKRIPAKLVRADLVPLYGIVGGTTTVVISED